MFIVTQLRNESKREIEWIKYYNSIGIEKFIIYDDNSSDNTVEVLRELSGRYNGQINFTKNDKNYIDTTNPDQYGTPDLHRRILSSMNDGLNQIKNDILNHNKWCFFIEVDEFIKADTDLN